MGLVTPQCALYRRENPGSGWALAHQWQSPINAIDTVGDRIAALHGGTLSFSDGGGRFEVMSNSDVTSIKWLDETRLLIGRSDGLVHSIDLP